MAMTIPPWIRPASPEYYMQGFSQGEGIAERQNRAEAAIQEMTMRREAQQRQDQMAAVNLATSLQHMALAKQAADEKAREAALKWQWQQDLSGRINAGEDPVSAWEQSTARFSPQAFGTYAWHKRAEEAKQQAKAKQYGEIKTMDLTPDAMAVYREGSPGVHVVNKKTKTSELTPNQIVQLHLSATRMMEPRPSELPTDQAYKDRIATAKAIMDKYPLPLTAGTNAPPGMNAKGRTGIRVKVKSPQGKFGHIPEEEVEQALAEGYTLME